MNSYAFYTCSFPLHTIGSTLSAFGDYWNLLSDADCILRRMHVLKSVFVVLNNVTDELFVAIVAFVAVVALLAVVVSKRHNGSR